LSSKDDKWLICHNGRTICIAKNAVAAHISRGDTYGPCTTTRSAKPIQKLEPVPAKFTLGSYPNPFSNITRIPYSVAIDARVSIKVFDMVGREVDIIFNGERAADSYSVEYNTAKLSPGVYYCKMIATANGQQFIQTQKLVKTD
jgi:hypothetical protein